MCADFCFATEKDGFCSQDDGASKTGAQITKALAIELWLEIKAEFGKKKRDLFSYRFFDLTKTLDEECKPISIPGLFDDTTESVPELLPVPIDLISSPPL